MSESERFRFDDFTTAHYRDLLRLAQQSYEFRTYSDFEIGAPHVLWRHDVDISPQRAVRLAEIEAEEGVVATYFIRLHSEFYNFWDARIVSAFKRVAFLGHELGLHFEVGFDRDHQTDRFEERLLSEANLVEEVFGRPVKAFSMHDPTDEDLSRDEDLYAGLVNTYARRFWRDARYCSDSNGYWRFERLADVLAEEPSRALQVLTHPVWWQESAMSPRERVRRSIEGRAIADQAFYDALLERVGRENVDGDSP